MWRYSLNSSFDRATLLAMAGRKDVGNPVDVDDGELPF